MLIFIITVKFVIDSDLLLGKIKSLAPSGVGGKYLNYIISKFLLAWKASSIFWVYFILFFSLIFSCCSSYAIYGCLVGLSRIIT